MFVCMCIYMCMLKNRYLRLHLHIVQMLSKTFTSLSTLSTPDTSIFSDPDVVRELSRLHENFVTIPADKASNNYTFVCKRHYVSIFTGELGLNSLPGNPTYNITDFSALEVLDNHKSVLTSFGTETSDDELRFAIHILDSTDAQKPI